MKFKLEDIPPEGREESFSEDEKTLNERLGGETTRSYIRFAAPLEVRVRIFRSGTMVTVQSRVEAQAKATCARCLESFSLTLRSEYPITLRPKPMSPPPDEVELTRQDLETDFYDGEEVDVSPLVQDQVLLAIPPKLICREDCRGLCPCCGKNLNRETCDCPTKAVDPRLEVLKNFRIH